MAWACPVTTKWKVVGDMDTAPWVWVIVAVVVVVLIVLLLLAGGRRRKAMQEKRDQEHREKAAEIRREAENMEIDAREREAKAIRARADAEQAQVDAARLRQEAEHRTQEAQSLRGDVANRTRKADELDPDVGRDGAGVAGREDRDRGVHSDLAGHGPAHAGPAPEAGRDAGYVDAGHAGDGRLPGTHQNPAAHQNPVEHRNEEYSNLGTGHGAHEEASAEGLNQDIPDAESGRRRHPDAGGAATERDVRGEGNPRV